MRRILIFICLLAVIPPVSAQTAGVNPAYLEINVSESGVVSVDVNSVSNLYGYQVSVSFDSGYLDLLSVNEGSFLNESGAASTFFGSSGTNPVSVYSTRLGEPDGVSGSGTLFSLTFNGTNAGLSAITLDVTLSDVSQHEIIVTENGGQINVTYASEEPPPEPPPENPPSTGSPPGTSTGSSPGGSSVCSEGDTEACGSDVGTCVSGTRTCENGEWGTCVGELKPAEEICDRRDNDCDNETDENLECGCYLGDQRDCGSNVGVCKSGTMVCLANGKWDTVCTGSKGPSSFQDICFNNKDDDCDGEIDEECISLQAKCSNGIRDGDEEGVDCGGSCERSCEFVQWGWFALFAVLIFAIITFIGYMMKRRKHKPLFETPPPPPLDKGF